MDVYVVYWQNYDLNDVIQKRKKQLRKALEHDFPDDDLSSSEKWTKKTVLEVFRNFVLYGKITKAGKKNE